MVEPVNVPIATIGKNKGTEVRVSLATFAGQNLIDVRTYISADDSGELRPSKKGVSLSFAKVEALLSALTLAAKRGREMGWEGEA